MRQFMTVFKKENLESWRNFSWIWVPIVFILLALMDPITTHYLPILLENIGGLPEEMVFEFPAIPAADALMMSLTQFSSLGALIIILLTMGTIAGERKSGITELILVKPINHAVYIGAKWLAKLTLFFTSFLVGMLLTWYYVDLLFGPISTGEFLATVLFYGLWIMFVVTLTVFFSTIFKGSGPVAGITIITLIALSIFNSIFSNRLPWFPSELSNHIRGMLHSGTISTELWGTGFILIILNAVLLGLSFTIFKNKKITE